MQNLPIGEQDFRSLRQDNKLYVDKTEQIHRLLTTSKYYFLSRPRRFGKSLTLATIEEIFRGSRELFEGLWIENHWNWSQKHPVVHLPCNKIDYQAKGLEKALTDFLDTRAAQSGLVLAELSAKAKMTELVEKLAAAEGPVVLLVDEYDKPIIDYLEKEDLPTAKANRKTLKTFYSGLKDKDSQAAMRLFLITGVSKFSQVSVFSDLNYLDDITLDKNFAELVGYTQAELESNFAGWLQLALDDGLADSPEALLADIKAWYDGYSWDASHHVYNPFSVLNFFSKRSFGDYWFKSGTPGFLLSMMEKRRLYRLNDLKVNKTLFDSYDLENMDIRALLFQTGYLTIRHIDSRKGEYTLDYPNREVEEAMHSHLIATLLHRQPADSTQPVFQLEDAFLKNDVAKAVTVINSMLKDLPSHIVSGKDEHFCHALVHLHFRYLGLFIQSEVHTSDGRMDAAVTTPDRIFVLEFKLDESAETALRQIHEKGYADKFRLEGKPLTAVGVNFNSEKKAVDGWLAEAL